MQNNQFEDGAAQVLLECADLLERKGRDYNGSGVNRDDYYLYGRKSLMTMIHTKYLRLRSGTRSVWFLNRLRNRQPVPDPVVYQTLCT